MSPPNSDFILPAKANLGKPLCVFLPAIDGTGQELMGLQTRG